MTFPAVLARAEHSGDPGGIVMPPATDGALLHKHDFDTELLEREDRK
jgi:hypothetical protein